MHKLGQWIRRRLTAGEGQSGSYALVSYPKSGRTWLRLMIGRALADHLALQISEGASTLSVERFSRIDPRAPRLELSHDGSPFLQSKEELRTSKSEYRSKRVILLVRDPRDVVVSSWHRRGKAAGKYGEAFEGSISDYLRHPVHGIEKIVAFLNAWAAARDVPERLLCIRYEDLIDDAEAGLREALVFLGFESLPDETLQAAVDYGRFENMQALERNDTLGSAQLRPLDPADPTTFKVRRGQPGGYRDELAPDDVAFADRVIDTQLDAWFGYGRTAQSSAKPA